MGDIILLINSKVTFKKNGYSVIGSLHELIHTKFAISTPATD